MLAEMFERQAELNKRIGYDTAALHESFDPLKAGVWLNDYISAACNELEELRDSTYWKHWCAEAKEGRRFEIHDLQNARVEVIDLLFFWISMAQVPRLHQYRQGAARSGANLGQTWAKRHIITGTNREPIYRPLPDGGTDGGNWEGGSIGGSFTEVTETFTFAIFCLQQGPEHPIMPPSAGKAG
ncbi:MAG: dUTP diphosphatase [Planctomycetota bacterium]|jgi:hypothetical protein